MQFVYVFIVIVFFAVSLEAFVRVERAATANCPKITDFPGRIKYRRKGTRANFRCPKKFDRYGAKNADCQADGTWSDPPPLCIKAGCVPIDPSQQPNLDMEVVNSALVRFSCLENYKLLGSKEVYCDGLDWSGGLPRCAAPHELTECDFEEDLCGWTQDDADEQDWTRISGPTQTGNTGPKYDHTYGTSKSGHYIFFEASAPTAAGDEAKLLSPVYTPDLSPMCFDFWYHILGPDEVGHVGSLEVSVIDQSQFEEDIQPMFVKEGNQGDQWHRGEIFIDKQDEPFQVMIVAKRALSYFSDIAVDDVRLYDCTATKASKRVPTGSTTESTTESSTTESTTETTTRRKQRPTKPKPVTTKKPTPQPPTTKKPTPQPPTPQPPTPQPTTIATTMKPTTQTTPKLPELTSTTTHKTTTEPIKIPTSTKLVTSAPTSSTPSPATSTSAVKDTTKTSAPISTTQISTPSPETTKTAESTDSIEPTITNAINTTEAPKPKTSVKVSVSTDGISTIKPTSTGKVTTVMTSSQPLSSTIPSKSTRLPTSATSSTIQMTSPKVTQTTSNLVSTTLKSTDFSTTMSTSSTATTSIQNEITSSTHSTIKPGEVSTNSVTNPTQLSTDVQTKSTTKKPSSTEDQTTITFRSTIKEKSSLTTETKSQTTLTTTSPETSSAYVKTTAKPSTETAVTTIKPPSSVITGSSPPQKSTKRSNSLTTKSIITSNSSKDNSISVSEQRSEHPADETLKPLMIGLGVGIVVGLIIIGVIAYVCVRRRKFYTSRYEDELKPITNSASVQSLNGSNGHFYQDGDYEAET